MTDSILTSVKKMLGLNADYTHFDPDIIMHINSSFFILHQLGVGPDSPFMIEDANSKWDDFIIKGDIEAVKSYVFLKVRSLFDPPSNASLLNAMNEQIKEFEWRLNVEVDPGERDE